jgi:hypothetical protein
MSGSDEEHPEDLLGEALAAFDDRLAAGMETPGGIRSWLSNPRTCRIGIV